MTKKDCFEMYYNIAIYRNSLGLEIMLSDMFKLIPPTLNSVITDISSELIFLKETSSVRHYENIYIVALENLIKKETEIEN